MALYEHLLPECLKPPENRKGEALVDYLIAHPDAAGDFRFGSLDSKELVRLLSRCPQFADRCNTAKITLEDASDLVAEQPGFLDLFKAKGLDWVKILCRRPELVKKLACYMDRSAWSAILCRQPELWGYSPFHHFDTGQWSQLIRDQPALAKWCPWETLNFVREWRDSLLLYPELVLSHRKDWKPFRHLGGYSPAALAPLIARKPELGEKADFGMFDRKEWEIILESQPQLIDRCDVAKIFSDVPLRLIAKHPELADRFDWSTCSSPQIFDDGRWYLAFSEFVRAQPQLARRVLKSCRTSDWEYLLPKFPEYLLEYDCHSFVPLENLRAFLLAGFLDFDGTGLDSICNNLYDRFKKRGLDPTDWFETESFTPSEFLIRSVMDFTNAKRYFAREVRIMNWHFCFDLLACDGEALFRFLPREKCAFWLCASAPGFLWNKFLSLHKEALSFLDTNGNTLLHAAFMRATFEGIDVMLTPGHKARKRYDSLVRSGCDPDRKNKRGVSCSDLLAMISGKVGLWTEKLVKMTESAREKEV